MRKELRPTHDSVSCDICGRSILKGERAEPYLAPGGQRMLVCELCGSRAQDEGWIRESAHGDLPATRKPLEPKRSFFGRRRAREGPELALDGEEPPDAVPDHEEDAEPAAVRRKDARHVRAVPTNQEVKIERALDLFNHSEHPRTIAGVARSLGAPWASATPSPAAASQVTVVVAWELSWYRWRVDLGDEVEPVVLLDKGHELDQLTELERDWNVSVDSHGVLAAGPVGSQP